MAPDNVQTGDATEAVPGPLHGVRVIDVGTRISAPFCAGLLGELGADVIKVELPGGGDFMRTMGPFIDVEGEAEDPYSLSWAVEGRGRRGVTCDLRTADGKALFMRLAEKADVICENFGLAPWRNGVWDPTIWIRASSTSASVSSAKAVRTPLVPGSTDWVSPMGDY